MKRLIFLHVDMLRERMSSKKPKKKTQLDLIKSVRRELPPKGKTFRVKKNEPFRKQKYKAKIDSESM